MKKFIAIVMVMSLITASYSFAVKVGCWGLEEGSGAVAANSGTGANCDLRVINDQGVNSAVWTNFVPSISGINSSVWNENIAGAWGIQSWVGYGNGVDDPAALDMATNVSFTLLARVYMTDNGWDDGIVCKSAGASLGYYLARSGGSAGNTIRFRMQDENGQTDLLEYYGNAATLSGTWAYVAVVRDCAAAQGRIYVNGTKEVESAITAVGSLENTSRFKLGNIWASASDNSLCGYIAEAAVFDSALTDSQIQSYNNMSFTLPEPFTLGLILLPLLAILRRK